MERDPGRIVLHLGRIRTRAHILFYFFRDDKSAARNASPWRGPEDERGLMIRYYANAERHLTNDVKGKKLTPYARIVEATVMIRHGNERNVFRPKV